MSSLSRLLAILAITLVAGCAQLSTVRDSILTGGTSLVATVSNPVGKQELATVERGYGLILVGLNTYKRSCIRKELPVSCRGNVVTLQAYQKQAQSAVLAARRFVKENPTLNAFSAISAATAAIGDFKNAAVQMGAVQ